MNGCVQSYLGDFCIFSRDELNIGTRVSKFLSLPFGSVLFLSLERR